MEVVAQAVGRTPVRGREKIVRRLIGLPPARPSVGRTRLKNGLVFLFDTSSYLEWRLYYLGEYEPEVWRVIDSLLRPGDVAIDVGANIGIHALPMARKVGSEGRVVAVEPFERAAVRLAANAALNGLQVDLHTTALSDDSHPVLLLPPDPHNEGSAKTRRHGHGQPVSTATLDQIAAPLTALKLVKIDVEGWEPEVLRGASESISRFSPNLIFEVNPGFGRAAVEFEFLNSGDYDLFEITRSGLKRLGAFPEHLAMILARPQ
jgi:FkbM family methyltransferase